ncbi:MAG: right-handed parallel beta-helix repeat-containing protein [Myxococcota bacterium]
MRALAMVCGLALLACSGDGDAGDLRDAPDIIDTAADVGGDLGRDGGSDLDAAPDANGDPGDGPDAETDGLPPTPSVLRIESPKDFPPGVPVPVGIVSEASPPLDGVVTLTAGGKTHSVRLYHGRGSVSLGLTAPATLRAAAVGHAGERAVGATARGARQISGELSSSDLAWSRDADVLIAATATVPVGSTLRIGAGTRVLLADGADLEVLGRLEVSGSQAEPVLFAPAAAAWGSLRVLDGASATLSETWLTGGGGVASKAFGHSGSQPVVRVRAAELEMSGGGIVDCPGKAFGTNDALLTLTGVLISRVDTGGEHERARLSMERCHVVEIPDGDGEVDDDDNDGIYLLNAAEDGGAPVVSVIRDSVFAAGEDDAIDHNGASVLIERVRIDGFAHEGVAASSGGVVTVRDSVVRGCDQGIEAGYGSPEVRVERCLVTGNGTGLRFGDSYDWADDGQMIVEATVAVGNTGANVLNLPLATMKPKPGAIVVSCSMVDSAEFDGEDGNLAGVPSWDAAGCVEVPAAFSAQCGAGLGPAVCR